MGQERIKWKIDNDTEAGLEEVLLGISQSLMSWIPGIRVL